MSKDFSLRPPPGVAYNQWKDGSIHFNVSDENVTPLRAILLQLADSLAAHNVGILEKQKSVELGKFSMPPTRIQILEQQLEAAKAEEANPKTRTIITGGFVGNGAEEDYGPPPAQI
jgi:hypothetical protein